MQTQLLPMSEPFVNEKTRHDKSASVTAYNYSYLNSRQIHEGERLLLFGQVLIEDRANANKGKILLKERFAVLCPTRMLLFKRSFQ